jgi:hypothetical protein
MNLRKGWYYFTLIGIFFLIMIVLGILALYNLVFNHTFPKYGFKALLKSTLDTLTPVFVYMSFIPVVNISLEIFNCGYEYKGSDFLEVDCYQDCWSAEH